MLECGWFRDVLLVLVTAFGVLIGAYLGLRKVLFVPKDWYDR